MNKRIRFFAGVALWLAIYLVGLRGTPAIGAIAALVKAHAWLTRGDITQVTFLICSLLAFGFLRGRQPGAFGFRGAPLSAVAKAVGWSALISLAFVVLSSLAMQLTGPKPPGAEHPMMEGGFLKIVLTVWILASICEEIFYRGLLQGFLDPLRDAAPVSVEGRRSRRRLSLPVLVSALAFGLGHFCLLGAMPPPAVVMIVVMATCLGLIAGRFREETSSLVPAVAAHMTFNVVGTTVPLLMTALLRIGK